MARRSLQVTLALVVVTATATLSSGQQTVAAFPALPSCPPAPLSLSPCIGYVFGAGSATLNSCCSQLRNFLLAQAPCLCAASKLAPSPVGLFLGQAQAMIPNVCDLPNPCDDAAAGEGSVPSALATTPLEAGTPLASATTPTDTTPATEPSSSTPATDPLTAGAPPAPAEEAPFTATAPAGTGTKLPELLHAAGAASSRDVAAGTVFVAVFLASVATMYV